MTTSRVDVADGSVMHPDEVHDVPEALGRRLIESGQAVAIERPRPATRARQRQRATVGPQESRG